MWCRIQKERDKKKSKNCKDNINNDSQFHKDILEFPLAWNSWDENYF